jgi:hypothetical protein
MIFKLAVSQYNRIGKVVEDVGKYLGRMLNTQAAQNWSINVRADNYMINKEIPLMDAQDAD